MRKVIVWALMLAPLAAAAAEPPAGAATGQVNVNTASMEELMTLPGIGPAKAKAIVEYRSQKPFKTPEDLLRVRGIGRGIFKDLRDLLAVSGPTTYKPAGARRPNAP
jgi:competence protein ComEA